MNAPATLDAPKKAPAASNQLATMANIADLVAGRNAAIAHWLAAYDAFHRETDAARAACIGAAFSLSAPYTNKSNDEGITEAFVSTRPHIHHSKTGIRSEVAPRVHFESVVTTLTDRGCWRALMRQLGFDRLLDRQAREEFEKSLQDQPPAFTEENCAASFGTLWASRREMYLRGIANTFMAMDRRFRSHDAFAIGNRLIIDRAFSPESSWWVSDNRRDTLHDVERIFRELDGKEPIPLQYGIGKGETEGEGIVGRVVHARQGRDFPMVVENDYFRVRVFQNGNLHLWFTRKDLLKQVNALLLEYYRPVEGDVGDGPSYERGPAYHSTPAKNFGQFFSSDDVAQRVMAKAEITAGMRVLEPSAGSGVLARAARAAGAIVECVELQPGLAHELRAIHGFGQTTQADFLQLSPADLGEFDVIVMNPPFDRGRDCDHVRHAWQFLKPGGRLVAVMSARAEHATDSRHKALHELIATEQDQWRARGSWSDLPAGSFAHAGTNVNTVLLTIDKPRRR